MNKRVLHALFTIVILTAVAAVARADFVSVGVTSVTASCTLSGNPVVSHNGLTQLTTDYYAAISAITSVRDASHTLASIYVNYYVTSQIDYSTATIAVGVSSQSFTTIIQADLTNNPSNFYYRITVADSAGLTGYWPPDGSFHAVGITIPNPVIEHKALTSLTADNYAVIAATVSCATSFHPLSDIFINYYTSSQTSFSTAAVTVNPSVVTEYFSQSVPVDVSANPDFFYYRITAKDNAGRTGYWPQSSAFNAVGIAVPNVQIIHSPVTYVSAVTGVVVASGTVSGNTALGTVGMYYGTDLDVNFSSYTINMTSAPLAYNFRFVLDKKDINLAKAKTFKYYLKASNAAGKNFYLPTSGAAFTSDIISAKTIALGNGGGTVSLPNGNPQDGQTGLDIPQGALDGNTAITITELDPNDVSVPAGRSPCASVRPMAVYTFGPENLNFKKFVTMKLLYQDNNHDGVVEGTNYKTNTLRVFWWDGFDWRLYGGKNDTAFNLVNYPKIKHFSMYALFPVSSLNDNDYRPKERIITPATIDNKNDFAMFDGLTDGDKVNIYDVNGKRVRQLTDDFSWDGKDESGSIVESGIYIYQIKLGESGKIISGTVVVAK